MSMVYVNSRVNSMYNVYLEVIEMSLQLSKILQSVFSLLNSLNTKSYTYGGIGDARDATQKAKIAEKVHKPPLAINVINFEINGFNASIWVLWSPSES